MKTQAPSSTRSAHLPWPQSTQTGLPTSMVQLGQAGGEAERFDFGRGIMETDLEDLIGF